VKLKPPIHTKIVVEKKNKAKVTHTKFLSNWWYKKLSLK